MNYVKLKLKSEIPIDSVISLHYFEYAKDFAFSGEIHDFWELVYVDKDELFVTAGGTEFLLKAKQLYLHKPMEFHNIRCNGEIAANSVIMSFSSNSPILYSLAGRIIDCGVHERSLMASIISEAKDSFSTPLGDPYTAELLRSEKPRFAGEQLISNYLQILLIRLVRLYIGDDTQASSPQIISETQNSQLAKIISFLEENVESRITFPDVCEHFGISGSHLKKIFKNEIGSGVMEYYNKCKIDRAKKLIRERELNFSQISEKLEFNSVQYFSRAFRAHTGMTPSEYEESVISMVDKK